MNYCLNIIKCPLKKGAIALKFHREPLTSGVKIYCLNCLTKHPTNTGAKREKEVQILIIIFKF